MNDIDANVKALTEAFENDDNEAGKVAAISLVVGVFKDVRRIADALTIMSHPAASLDDGGADRKDGLS